VSPEALGRRGAERPRLIVRRHSVRVFTTPILGVSPAQPLIPCDAAAVGQLLRTLRRGVGLTQSDLALRLGPLGRPLQCWRRAASGSACMHCSTRRPNSVAKALDSFPSGWRPEMARVTQRYAGVSLFSGCGGVDLGAEQTGSVRVVWAVDSDHWAVETSRRNLGTHIVESDIAKVAVPGVACNILLAGRPARTTPRRETGPGLRRPGAICSAGWGASSMTCGRRRSRSKMCPGSGTICVSSRVGCRLSEVGRDS